MHRSALACAATITLSATLSGCFYPPTRPYETFSPLPFDEAEYSALQKTGSGTIKGQVFAKTVGGEVKKGAGNNVVLFPATKYGTQRYTEQILRGKLAATEEDPRYIQYVKVQVADADGRFTFTSIPPGRYYIVSHIVWEAPMRYGPETQGGKVAAMIDVRNDDITEIMLAR